MYATDNGVDKITSKQVVEKPHIDSRTTSPPSLCNGVVSENDDKEVFKTTTEGVDFRRVTWQRLIIILLKVQVATGVLGIPSAMGTLGAVPGALVVVGCQVLNTCALQP